MQTVRGDLFALGFAGEFDAIIHGCNCHNTMGAGIAKSVKQQFPAAYHADQNPKLFKDRAIVG